MSTSWPTLTASLRQAVSLTSLYRLLDRVWYPRCSCWNDGGTFSTSTVRNGVVMLLLLHSCFPYQFVLDSMLLPLHTLRCAYFSATQYN